MARSYIDRRDFFESTIHRFWSVVDKSGDCWIWNGHRDKPDQWGRSYGKFTFVDKGRTINYKAHRLAYTLFNGIIPDGKIIMHSCDNTFCVNPDHLSVGTHTLNAHDRDAKGRCQQGTGHYAAKLTRDQVLAIFDDKDSSHAELARKFGINASGIMKIRRGEKWKRLLKREGRIQDGPPTITTLQGEQ